MRSYFSPIGFGFLVLLCTTLPCYASQTPSSPDHQLHHDVKAHIDVESRSLTVVDTLHFRPSLLKKGAATRFFFYLHASADVSASDAQVRKTSQRKDAGFSPSRRHSVPFQRWELIIPAHQASVRLRYRVTYPTMKAGQEPNGFVSPKAIFLSPNSLWLPTAHDVLTSAKVEVSGIPKHWSFLTEGKRLPDGSMKSHTPVEGLHLLTGEWHSTTIDVGKTKLDVWLTNDDPTLRQHIQHAGGQALRTYEKLLGEFPYPRFTVVESAWESGLGMPGFTLFGSHLLRYSFVRNQSLPHEILHSYFGTGVFVKGGNWSEGLTSYLADHFRAEQLGESGIHRRRILQKYAAFVSPENDFAVERFQSKTSAASEAIGYGKWSMVLHNFRRQVGDDVFKQVLRTFTGRFLYKKASFANFVEVASTVSKRDWKPFFTTWLQRKGLPNLRWEDVRLHSKGKKHTATISLKQTQKGQVFQMGVPLFFTFSDGSVAERMLFFTSKKTATSSFTFSQLPLRVDIDPRFEVPRKLHALESPPTLAAALNAKRFLFVGPAFASIEMQQGYRDLAESICGGPISSAKSNPCRFVRDDAEFELDESRAIFIFGFANRLRGAAARVPIPYRFDDKAFHTKSQSLKHNKGDLVVVLRHPRTVKSTLAFVGSSSPQHLAIIAKKLPHYGKYSLLSFSGDDVKNRLKQIWSVESTPLQVALVPGPRAKTTLPKLKPLQEYEPSFSTAALHADVAGLENAITTKTTFAGKRAELLRVSVDQLKKFGGVNVVSVPSAVGCTGSAAQECGSTSVTFLGSDAALPSTVLVVRSPTPLKVALLFQVLRLLKEQPHKLRTLHVVVGAENRVLKNTESFLLEMDFAQPFHEALQARAQADDVKEFLQAASQATNIPPFLRPGAATSISADTLAWAALAAETLSSLGNLKSNQRGDDAESEQERPKRANLGIVPDYRFEGKGVRVHGIVSGSPAAKAGIISGDVIAFVDGRALRSLRQYSFLLYRLQPSSQVKMDVIRGEKKIEISLNLEAP
ncbi:MAG: PDZ domain-containing protein [Deltaproteobacteria bacterium]|nr:PDZ domain-containing protein [Deltaproteobacteria bacterium]